MISKLKKINTYIKMEFKELIKAIDSKKIFKVKRMLDKNHSLMNWKNGQLLNYVAHIGHFDLIKYLIHSGIDINIGEAVEKACEKGYTDIAIYLIEQGCKYNLTKSLVLACYNHDNVQLVKYLIKKGADVVCENNWCMLHTCMRGHYNVVKFLASRFEIDSHCIFWASFYEKLDILNILCRYRTVEYFPANVKKYILFFQKTRTKKMDTSAKIIYFWWVQSCYSPNSLCGHRSMQKSYKEYLQLI